MRAVKPDGPGLDRANSEHVRRGPRIIAQTCLNRGFVRGLDDQQGPLAVSERATEDHEAIVDEPVHEGGVIVPGTLLANRQRVVPVRAVRRREHEEGHDVNVPTGAPADRSSARGEVAGSLALGSRCHGRSLAGGGTLGSVR